MARLIAPPHFANRCYPNGGDAIYGVDVEFIKERLMSYKRFKHTNLRRKNFDYSSAGYYFVTIRTRNKDLFFGDISGAKLLLNETGRLADLLWREIPSHFPHVGLDEYIIMPNHIHGILFLDITETNDDISDNQGGITGSNNPMINPYSLSKIIRWFKGRVSFEVRKIPDSDNFNWQSRFYDRIIHNDEELEHYRRYIRNNPENWEIDEEYK